MALLKEKAWQTADSDHDVVHLLTCSNTAQTSKNQKVLFFLYALSMSVKGKWLVTSFNKSMQLNHTSKCMSVHQKKLAVIDMTVLTNQWLYYQSTVSGSCSIMKKECTIYVIDQNLLKGRHRHQHQVKT